MQASGQFQGLKIEEGGKFCRLFSVSRLFELS